MKQNLYICDYQIPRSDEVDSFLVEADNDADAERKAYEELKALNIPKRYLIQIIRMEGF